MFVVVWLCFEWGKRDIWTKNQKWVGVKSEKILTQNDKKNIKADRLANVSTWNKLNTNKDYLEVVTTFQDMTNKSYFLWLEVQKVHTDGLISLPLC